MESKKTQRKFFLACFFAGIASLALFIPPYPMSGGNYIAIAALILGIYGGANVIEKLGWPGNGDDKK